MKLTVLENPEANKITDNRFFNRLLLHFKLAGTHKVLYEYFDGSLTNIFYKNTNTYYLKEKNIWFSRIIESKRSIYAFGHGKPNSDVSNKPSFVIDFSLDGLDKNCLGVFAKNNEGRIVILIRLNYSELRKTLLKYNFTNNIRIRAFEREKQVYLIKLSDLNDTYISNNIANFIEELESLRENNPEENKKKTENQEFHNENCILCGKEVTDLDKDTDNPLRKILTKNSGKCPDCLEKICTIVALKEIQKQVTRYGNSRGLLSKSDNPSIFEYYLEILKKYNLIKEINNEVFMLNTENKEFIEYYSQFLDEETEKTTQESDLGIKHAEITETINQKSKKDTNCEICHNKLPKDSHSSKESNNKTKLKCKDCSRKAYAAKAIGELREYVDPDTSFKKDDLFKIVDNRMQFLDYIWTLQEQNLLEHDERTDAYTLKSEKELDKFIGKYGDDNKSSNLTPEIKKTTKKAKINKECETCGQKLSISQFYKSIETRDGYSNLCKLCSRKSYASKALGELMTCVNPGIEFNKKDILNGCEDPLRFLDYLWTLQEFDLLNYDDKTDFYTLKPEKELNQFVEKYGDKKELVHSDEKEKNYSTELIKDQNEPVEKLNIEIENTTNEENVNINETSENYDVVITESIANNPEKVKILSELKPKFQNSFINNITKASPIKPIEEFNESFIKKKILYFEENPTSESEIILKAKIPILELSSILSELDVFSEDINKLIMNRHDEQYFDVLIELSISKESSKNVLGILEEQKWEIR